MTDRTLRPRIAAEPTTDAYAGSRRPASPVTPANELARETSHEQRAWFHRGSDLSEVASLVRSLYVGPSLAERSLPASGSHSSVALASGGVIDLTVTRTELLNGSSEVTPHSPRVGDTNHRVASQLPLDTTESTESQLVRRLRTADFVVLPNNDLGYRALKRLIDVVGAALLLLCSLPLFLALVVLIRLDSPGPAIFRQTRVTRNGRHFTFLKFRTMYADARDRFPEHYRFEASHDAGDVYYKLADDPRNTRVGRWLRRTTLDELPNLLNVLKGDISLVGPRPDLPELVRFYSDLELSCLLTKAGMTGSAQTRGRSLLTMKERLRVDLFYVSHQSTWLDLKLMARTALVVVLGRGAF